jgi:hypothetical protein
MVMANQDRLSCGSGWIISPIFDLLFFANVYWVLAFLPLYTSSEGEPYIQFWMAYFLATPHRWLTLFVAVTDRDRRQGQTWLFLSIGILIAALIGVAVWISGDFRSLSLLYTLVLGWHFAGQHQLVWNIYSGQASTPNRWFEQILPMLFIMYTNVRLVSFVEPMLRIESVNVVRWADTVMLFVPGTLLASNLSGISRERLPRLLYISSVLGLWSSVLWTTREHQDSLCSIILGAVTVFHSVEYLALVSFYARRRQEIGSRGLFREMACHWGAVLGWFVIVSGMLYTLGNVFFSTACFAVNIWASFVHCAYDGIMWRVRDPATAKILGV